MQALKMQLVCQRGCLRAVHLRHGLRCFSSLQPHHVVPNEAKGLVELRQYTLKPEGIKEFMALTRKFIETRKQLLPFLG